MNFESFQPSKPEEEKKDSRINSFENKVRTGILLSMSVAAIALGCGNENNQADSEERPMFDVMSDIDTATLENGICEKEKEVNQYEANLGVSLERYLQKVKGGKSREIKKENMLARVDRAEKIIWQNRFNGNYAGQVGYLKQIINDSEHREDVRSLAMEAAEKYGVPYDIIVGIMGNESGVKQFKIDADGKKHRLGSSFGAVGIMGVTPIAGVGAGIFTREQLFIKNKKGKSVVDKAKNEKLTRMLADNMELNISVGSAFLAFYAKRYNGDYGLALAAYSGRLPVIENAILKVYNDRQQRDYTAQRKAGKKSVFAPKAKTRAEVFSSRGGWPKFIRESGITIYDVIEDNPDYYPAQTYPFEVLQFGPVVDEILQSGEPKAVSTQLVTPELAERWKVMGNKQLAQK